MYFLWEIMYFFNIFNSNYNTYLGRAGSALSAVPLKASGATNTGRKSDL